MADTRESGTGRNHVLVVPVRRREFLSLGFAAIVGLSLFWAPGCSGSYDGGGNGKKNKKDNGGGGAGGYYVSTGEDLSSTHYTVERLVS